MAVSEPKWIDYTKVRWNPDWCKRCLICVEACPRHVLVLIDDTIAQMEGCDRSGMCQRLCPDLAIEVITSEAKMEE